jgi:methanogenic corrinoid protein MtbC1
MNSFLSKYSEHVSSSYVLKRLLEQKQNKNQSRVEYYQNLFQNEADKAFSVLSLLYMQGHSLSRLFDQIIVPTLEHIGVEWRDGKLEINMEHRMSFQISQHISEIGNFLQETKKKKQPVAILSCTPGNNHFLPILMGDVILKKHGFKREVLGINISLDELKKALNRNKDTKLICISNTYSRVDNRDYLRKLITLSKKNKINLILSGQGWSRAELDIADKNKVAHILSLVDFEDYIIESFK